MQVEYYGAGAYADMQRMKAEEDIEMTWWWDCTIRHLHFGMVGKFPPDLDYCPCIEEEERCFDCPVENTPYTWINTRLEETPKTIQKSMRIIREQMKRREISEAEAQAKDYFNGCFIRD